MGHREEAGEKNRLEAEMASSFGQGGFVMPVGGHPKGGGQKTARCLCGAEQVAPAGRSQVFCIRAGSHSSTDPAQGG